MYSVAGMNCTLAVSALIAVSTAMAEANNLTIVNVGGLELTSCNYSEARFLGGQLRLVLDNDRCVVGNEDGGNTGGGETEGGETEGGETEGGETEGGETEVPAACAPVASDTLWVKNHPWNQDISANVRTPISLKNKQVYTLTINKPSEARGSGYMMMADTVGLSGSKRMVISECPGSMNPTPGMNASPSSCVVQGSEKRLSWSHDANYPKGTNVCRLDSNKQYYVNISHQSSTGDATCSGECDFIYDYRFGNQYN